jgi:hypothetical protein
MTSNVTNDPTNDSGRPPALMPMIANNLVEISAVATLIGSIAAEQLTLGLKGSGGLAWSSITQFGALHVVKAALAAFVPDWARETLGLRGQTVDASIGLVLPYNKSKRLQHRAEWGDPVAVLSTYKSAPSTAENKPLSNEPVAMAEANIALTPDNKPSFQCIYCPDGNIALALATIQPVERRRVMRICEFKDDRDGAPNPYKDWLLIIASLVKGSEAVALRAVAGEAGSLWWISLMPTVGAFIGATILQVLGLGRNSLEGKECVDIVAGALPSALSFGGGGKILLGLARNVRRERLWKGVWLFITVINITSLIAIFVILSRSTTVVVCVWAAFQLAWVLTRTFVYFLADSATSRQAIITSLDWEEASSEQINRVMNLAAALVELQIASHPRGPIAYSFDASDADSIRRLLRQTKYVISDILECGTANMGSINIVGVLGDPALRTAAWFQGDDDVPNVPLYDACVIFLSVPGETGSDGPVIAVPSARVYANLAARKGYILRSPGNTTLPTASWLAWIPTKRDGIVGWTNVITKKMDGRIKCSFLTKEDEDEKLKKVEWDHTLRNSSNIEEVVEIAKLTATKAKEFWG